MDNRIDRRFAALRAASRKGLIPFVTAGDPDPAWTPAILHALVEAGADLLELGVPFSDPMADGPVIQRASERALAKGTGLSSVLEIVRRFRQRDAETPIVLMGYLNPLEIHGHARFLDAARDAGVDALLLVDSPVEESTELAAELAERGMHQITLIAPTTAAERLEGAAAQARGFVYYVSFAGITGADRLAMAEVGAQLARIRAASAVPLAIGFGIREPAQALALSADADAVVVGSALVEQLAGARDEADATARARAFLAPFRRALDAAGASAEPAARR
ncbi:MAG TPA: tryptophan synthase subunit alpha [Xanthomonadales bacterium]|nr:tryptophan synthase subunit alpha [Xanthomonadales bacterium]